MNAAPIRVWLEGDPVIVNDDLEVTQNPAPPPVTPTPKTPDPLMRQEHRRALLEPALDAANSVRIPTNYDGIGATGVLPPDPVGAVGPSYYIQMVNSSFAIYDKSGHLLAGPAAISSLWKGFAGPCETSNAGDPIVRYDHVADRWLVSQFQLEQFMQCIAVSRGPDPTTSGWYLYAFPTVDANGNNISADYPKIGVWPDGYYMSTQRGFPSGGLDVWVFERDKMLAGQPARQIQFSLQAPSIILQPSDLTGNPPPAGTPNFFLRQVEGHRFGGQDRLEMYALTTTWTTPESSILKKLTDIPVAPFNSVLCEDSLGGPCVPQPGTDVKLDTLSVWPMFPAQYRNFGDHEVLLLNHTVNVDGQGRAGIRWYELRRSPGGSWLTYQQGTHSPDSVNRWMGSLAMDRAGNIALAYSVSSQQTNPGIRVAVRHANDPLGVFGSEVTIVDGGGAQTHPAARWGDYASVNVDPSHPCAFWFTGLYYKTTSQANWSTRIAEVHPPGFSPDCSPQIPDLNGLTLSQAKKRVGHINGLAFGAIRTLPAESGPGKLSPPVVIQQSAEAGTQADKSNRIDITVQRVRQ
jgi:hypothetical protein